MKYAVTKNIFKLAASENINNVFSIVLDKISSWEKTLAEAARRFSCTHFIKGAFTQINNVGYLLDK